MPNTSTPRILDAALNRAGEGLRVVEDYVRFVLDSPHLTSEVKSLRHELTLAAAAISSEDRHAARDTQRDVGATVSTESENQRSDAWHVCSASLKRTEQSLRSIEEFGKLLDPMLARKAETLRYRLYTLEAAIDTNRSSNERLAEVTLCVLLDGCGSLQQFEKIVTELVEARVGMIQLRDKNLDDRELVGRARSLVSITRRRDLEPIRKPSGTVPNLRSLRSKLGLSPFDRRFSDRLLLETENDRAAGPRTLAVINDRADIAAAVHADGVHLGQEDISVKDARSIVGTRMLVGVSTHNIEQARIAVLDGANYLGAGPTFPSSTKSFEAFAGLDYLRQLATEIRLPAFAIGGIRAENLDEVLKTGFTRVAVSAAVTAAEKPGCAARELLAKLSKA